MLEHTNFVMRQSKKARLTALLESLCVVFVIAFFDIVIRGRGFSTPAMGFLIVLLVVSCSYSIVSNIFWRITVSGDKIYARTLFSKRSLDFGAFRSVEIKRSKIIVKAYPEEMAKAHPREIVKGTLILPMHCIGYEKFVARLKEIRVPGAEKLG